MKNHQPQVTQARSAAPSTHQHRPERRPMPADAALDHSPHLTAQRQSIRAAFGPAAVPAPRQSDAPRQQANALPDPLAPDRHDAPRPLRAGVAQLSKVLQFWGELWYEHLGNASTDVEGGSDLKGRTIGLPSFMGLGGWLEMKARHPKYPTYKVFMTTATFRDWNDPDKLSKVVDPTGLFELARQQIAPAVDVLRNEVTPLMEPLRPAYEAVSRQVTRENVEALRDQAISFERMLGEYLKNTWTPLKLVLGILGLGVLVGGGWLLALVQLPAWLVMSVEGVSFLYGTYLLYRWAQSDLLPTTVKTALLLLNGLAMGALTATTLYDVVGFYTGLIAAAPFQHIHFAAIPFALVLEYGIVRFIEKLRAMHTAAIARNAQRGPGAV